MHLCWCFVWSLFCAWALAADLESSLLALASLSRLSTSTSSLADSVITVPLVAKNKGIFFNVQLGDLAVLLDLQQPDLWVPRPEALIQLYCNVSDIPGTALSSRLAALAECTSDYPYGMLYAETTLLSDSGSTSTSSVETLIDLLGNPVSIAYPNAIVAEGEVGITTFNLSDTSEGDIILDDFAFVYVNHTNMIAGGLGLADNSRGTGFLNYFVNSETIKSHAYSAFMEYMLDNTEAAGELLLGAVNKKYFEGDFVSFPILPYTGLNSGSTLPTLLLSDLRVVNGNTSQSVSLLEQDPVPVLLDTRNSFNYFPLDVIIRLALQTNAFYNKENDEWIVKCSDVEESDAELHYQFGPLTIKAPLSSLLYASSNDTPLKFSGGAKACILNVSPSSYLGYTSLGLPFLTNAYFAVDNDGKHIALGNHNKNYTANTDFSLQSGSSKSNKSDDGASLIASGTIPFASTYNYTLSATLTINPANSSAAEAVLTKYSLASIVSGEVVVSGHSSSTVGPLKLQSSRSTSSKAMAGGAFTHWDRPGKEKLFIYVSLFIFGAFVGVVI